MNSTMTITQIIPITRELNLPWRTDSGYGEDCLWLLTEEELKRAADSSVVVESILGHRSIYLGDVKDEAERTFQIEVGKGDGARQVSITSYGIRESTIEKMLSKEQSLPEHQQNLAMIVRSAYEFLHEALEEHAGSDAGTWDYLPVKDEDGTEEFHVMNAHVGYDVAKVAGSDEKIAHTIMLLQALAPFAVQSLATAINEYHQNGKPISDEVARTAKSVLLIKRNIELQK